MFTSTRRTFCLASVILAVIGAGTTWAERPKPEAIESLRLAIHDLAATHPGKYTRAPEWLKRLDAVNDEAAFRALQREALLANPLLDFDRLLLVKRRDKQLGLPHNWQGNCALPKGGYDNEIAILSNNVLTTFFRPTNDVFVGDVDLNFDADKLLFSMPQPRGNWQVWQINADGTGLRQMTPNEPQVEHYDPCYLPDGRILFDSTAVFEGVPCVGGGNNVANLFRMDADGTNIRRLCFDQEHDWCPTVLNDGRVLYSRWEYTDTPHYFTRLLFRMNPDGTGQAEYYGSNSYWPNSIFYARPIPGDPNKVVAVISGHHGVPRMGELLIFDPAHGRQEADGAEQRIPGRGKKVEPIIRDGLVEQSWPKFLHPYPLSEKYFIVSCKPAADSPWGIYLVDVFDNMVRLAEQPGYSLFEPIPFRKTPRPPVIPDRVRLGDKQATVYLTDVYAGDGLRGVPRGTVKKLRVYEYHFAYPHMGGHINIGVDGPWDVHRILGTVPVYEDGSAAFKVPANTPIAVQPLDADGQSIQVMRSWFTAMPGENVSCAGCHEKQNAGPSARPTLATQHAPAEITPWHGPARGFSFPREVQPVLDKYCVGCHGEKDQLDLRGNVPAKPLPMKRKKRVQEFEFDAAYLELHPFVRRPGPESDYHVPKPYEFHASTSELIQLLRAGHHGVQLDAEAWDRLVTWIDLNVPDHGTWGEHRPVPGDFHKLRLEMQKKYANVDVDPESYPTPPPEHTAFVKPAAEPPKTADKTDWSFTGTYTPKTETVDLGNGQKLELTLIPGHQPFWLGRFEITNAQYRQFDPEHESGYIQIFNKDRGDRGLSAENDKQPVIRVTWQQATAFCEWLSKKTGRKFTLPTEHQWEWACRAGTSTPMWYGNETTDFTPFANLADAQLERLAQRDSPPWLPAITNLNDRATGPAPVGSYKPNPWGLYDMHGNVSEWTSADDQGRKVCRGGSFYDRPYRATSAARQTYLPYQPVFNVGFRVLCEP